MAAIFIFNHAAWEDMYVRNCSYLTAQEWLAEGPPNIPIGVLYMTFGVVCEIIYVPFMIAMRKPEFIQHSCYKFMFLLGIIDMIALPCISIIGGLQALLGLHFCLSPTLIYIAGCIGTCGWFGATMTCILLALDRFVEILFPKIAKILFHGKKIYFWLLIPIIYCLWFFFFQLPSFHNTKFSAFYYDPYYGTKGLEGNEKFTHLTAHVVNSFFTIPILVGVYAILCVGITIKAIFYKHAHISKLQRVMMLQSLCICMEICFVAIVYVGNQFYTIPGFMIIMEHFSWLCTHGDTPIVYMLLNESLRKAVFRLIKDWTNKSNNVSNNFLTSVITVARARNQIAS